MLCTLKVSDYFWKIFSLNPFIFNKFETKYVFRFIFAGLESTVKFLIENGADINAVNNINNSALIEAIKNGKQFKNWQICRKNLDRRSYSLA